ncbi:MAG: ABC transporter permease subunit [Eubacteriales bacterium]|nr:ABC transporter permease subunit [Eubacteriales bacterium]
MVEKKRSHGRVLTYLVLGLWALKTVYPFLWVILNSFRQKGMMFPVFSTIIPVFRMQVVMGIAEKGNRWLSLLATILPQIAGNLCFAIIILTGFIQSVPIELEESAYLDGCNVFHIFFRIIVPAAKSSFATVAIFAFLWSYNDLFTQSFFLRYPQERAITGLLNEISSQAGVNYGLMAASVVLVVVPVLIVNVCLQMSTAMFSKREKRRSSMSRAGKRSVRHVRTALTARRKSRFPCLCG